MGIVYSNKDFIGSNSEISIFFCMARQKEAMHSHEFWELTYVYEGEGVNYTDGKEYPVCNGELLFIKPGTEHTFIVQKGGKSGDVKMLNCLFTDHYLRKLLKLYPEIEKLNQYSLYKMIFGNECFCAHLANDSAQNMKKLMWLTEYEYSHFTDGSQTVIDNSMANMMFILIRLYEYSLNKKISVISGNMEMERLIKYINSNFSQKLSLSFLADYVHLSREYLSRYFKQYTGQNLSKYLLDIRMAHAKELLAISSYSIEDIGSYCGYPTISNFQRTFKSYTGISPGRYRKNLLLFSSVSREKRKRTQPEQQ